MDSDSDFYGDENTASVLEARVNNFDIESWWRNRNEGATPTPREDPKSSSFSGHLHNRYEGKPGAWQLTESVDDFLARLPPATTNWQPGLDWIFIGNPFIPEETKHADEAFLEGGTERLRLLSSFITQTKGSGKSPYVVSREISRARKETVQDLRELAAGCNTLSGKWMLFLEPNTVNEAWATVARATSNNELGTAAKVDTRLSLPSEKERLICVYTKDFRDEHDVARVLNRLRQLKLVRAGGKYIYYKCDAWTNLGIYGGNEWGIKASMYSSNEIFEYIKKKGNPPARC
ncbi:hypothetical protein B0H67DRAFT_482773 [Lasiosphaeris hirsuta]|uniref:DUF1917-domain-containing protein n=1 Tax=Lasiosphaeris hirsuta TaxID=260670 RepID=A0AA40AZB4_9PEZI|nr:hypothetical protein B0H67DRAFT_482773 [Lasiosphaeris hirsuta]